MYITRMPGTQHIGVDMPRLKSFLLEQHFEPEIIHELEIILLAVPTDEDIDDDLYEEYPDRWAQFLACAGKDAPTLQLELLTSLRLTAIEEANALWDNEAAVRSWNAWGQPDVRSEDAPLFAAAAPAGLLFCDGAIHPVEEMDTVVTV
jgi:hypothetical protein